MSAPFFSVIIPTLNEARDLPHLLTDLQRQTFAAFETFIVDAHSTDQTLAAARAAAVRRPATHILTSPLRQVGAQRNLGARKARGRWLIFLDADCRLPRYFFQGIRYQIDKLHPHILSTFIEPDTPNTKDQLIAAFINWYIDLLKTTTPTCLESVLAIKKSLFLSLGGFNPAIKFGEGNELLKRAAARQIAFTFCHEPRYTYSFRRFRKDGTLTVARAVVEHELLRFLGRRLPPAKSHRLYPMQGGAYFNLPSPPRLTQLRQDLAELTHLPHTYLNQLRSHLRRHPQLLRLLRLFRL